MKEENKAINVLQELESWQRVPQQLLEEEKNLERRMVFMVAQNKVEG